LTVDSHHVVVGGQGRNENEKDGEREHELHCHEEGKKRNIQVKRLSAEIV
jgi:hypothetical protein